MRAALQTRCWLEALRTLGLAPEEGEASWDMARAAFRAARPAPRAVPRRLPRRSPHLAGCRSAFLLTLPPRASSRPKASLAGVSMRDALSGGFLGGWAGFEIADLAAVRRAQAVGLTPHAIN